MATRIELARTLTYKAAWMVDQRRIDPALNAMAKYYAGETVVLTNPEYSHWEIRNSMSMGLTAQKLLSRTDFARQDYG